MASIAVIGFIGQEGDRQEPAEKNPNEGMECRTNLFTVQGLKCTPGDTGQKRNPQRKQDNCYPETKSPGAEIVPRMKINNK